MSRNERLPITCDEPRKLLPPARRIRAAPDPRPATVTLVVRSRGSEEEWRKLVEELTSGRPQDRRYLTRAEFLRKWGASPRDIKAVREFAAKQRLKVVSADPFRRCVVVSGTLLQHSRAFAVEFFVVKHPLGKFRSHRGAPSVPASIHPLIECILGLDNLPAAIPHAAAAERCHGMDRRALLEAYAIPPDLHGKGQNVAIIEMGGGFHQSDLDEYFGKLGLVPPRVRTRSIDGVKNDPAPKAMMEKFLSSGTSTKAAADPEINMEQIEWTIETMTDLGMVGTIAPEASILLVQAPNDVQGQYHAVTSVIATKNAPSVLSCSWGDQEPTLTRSIMYALDRWFQAAAVLGMTVCCSSGDLGAGIMTLKNGQEKLTAHFPASSPHVLACGGTALDPKAGTEVAWRQTTDNVGMAGGGGFSEEFPLPQWQRAAGIDPRKWIPSEMQSGEGRAVPDVAAKANLDHGYCVIVCGQGIPFVGTSAATPLWAGVVAILNEGLGARIGSFHALLYSGALHRGLRDIVAGDTGVFHACSGWDACTGWGSPRGKALLQSLTRSRSESNAAS